MIRESYKADVATLPDGRLFTRLLFEVDSAAERRVQILPAGPLVLARDGRSFVVSNPARVVQSSSTPMLVDWEHNSEKWNGSSRAAGWIQALEVDETGVWGRVAWTPEGEKDVRSEAYKFLSPVVLLDPDTRDALQIASVALTNTPALEMRAIEAFSLRTPLAATPGNTALPESVLQRLRANGRSEAEIIEAAEYSRRVRGAR